jgi:hypothetical protein
MWLVALASFLRATPASAQEPKVEVTALIGWAVSEGVNGDPVTTPEGNSFDRVDPTDSFTWGLMAGFLVNDHAEVGFVFRQQLSSLEASGTTAVDIGDFTATYYHGYFSYNFRAPRAHLRPYVMGGVGASS